MKLQLFDGGLNIRLNPILIEANQAVEIENVDTSEGVLKPSNGSTKTAIQSSGNNIPFYYEAADEWQDITDVNGYL